MSFAQTFLSLFPVPTFLEMPAAGLDISDHSIKFVQFAQTKKGLRITKYGTYELPIGAVIEGRIANREAIATVLSQMVREHGVQYVRASLPEEPAYIFTATVPAIGREEIKSLLQFKLEENVPVAPADAVIDFDLIASEPKDGQRIVAVSVVPQKVAQVYTDLLEAAGLIPISLEIEAQAIARTLVPKTYTKTCMTVDIGRTRSCISVVGGGHVRFTTTVAIGGDMLNDVLEKELAALSPEEQLAIKNNYGLSYSANATVRNAFLNFGRQVRNEIERYYIYWQTHKDTKASGLSIEKIILSGGYANIAGLPEYLTQELFVPVERANVWVNAFSLEKYIPSVSHRESLGYASAIGLALPRNTFFT